jgi:hypothetical protein
MGNSFDSALGALDSLAMSFVSVARISNQSFPFVSIPQFGIHVSKTIPLTGGLITNLIPVIKFEQREEWERYAAANNSYLSVWVEESFRLQDKWSNFYGPMPQNKTWQSNDVIHSDFGDIRYNVSRSGRLDVYLPSWQSFPLVLNSYYAANYGT